MAIKKTSTRKSKQGGAKKSSKKAVSTKSSTGRASVEKGRRFEDEVAELYRLLGAQVVQNIEIHQKKVDILATFRIPGSSREHSVIVECKDEKRVVDANQRIMAFKGLLVVARESGIADSAEIVTRVPWSDQAKGFAKTAGVELFTYTEKISQLIDLTSYLKGLVNKFDKRDPGRPADPPLGAYYVDLSAQKDVGVKATRVHGSTDLTATNIAVRANRIPIIDTYIHQWIKEVDTNRQLAIFGEYGSGKSTFCQKLARDLAFSYLNDPSSSRIPILLNLREFIGKLDLEAYITSFLDRECKVVNPKIELFRAMSEAGIFLMIFDGFDEMAVKVDADTLESNLIEIEKLVAFNNSKAILTSRPEYFINTREETESLSPRVNPFLNREAEYEPLKILPWNEEQVELFLQKRVPLVKGANQPWTYYKDQINQMGSLSDLAQRPVLLDMIVKSLPRLIASGEIITLPNLYKNYLLGEMKRQKVLKKRSFLLSDNDRLTLLEDLAIEIYSRQTQSITFTDAQTRIEKDINPPKQELEAHTRDFLTNSFLIRSGDEYRISHKSILEYLVAMRLDKEIQLEHPEVFGRHKFEFQVYNFLKEFKPSPLTLLKWIEMTKDAGHIGGTRLGSNAATLLHRISTSFFKGRDLSGTNLSDVNLYYADLRDCNLTNTLLINAELAGAQFYKKDIALAKLGETGISYYVSRTKETLHYNVSQFMDHFFDKTDVSSNHEIRNRIDGFRVVSTYRNDLLWEVLISVQDIIQLEAIRKKISMALAAHVAIYFNEIEHLKQEGASPKRRKKQAGRPRKSTS